MSVECPFCSPAAADKILENESAYARYDKYPVSPGHLLIVPHRHFENYFDRTDAEHRSLWELVDAAKATLEKNYSPDGFNIGINVGAAAGQTVPHLHIHLIPRFKNDMPDPRGGVRGVIPERQKY